MNRLDSATPHPASIRVYRSLLTLTLLGIVAVVVHMLAGSPFLEDVTSFRILAGLVIFELGLLVYAVKLAQCAGRLGAKAVQWCILVAAALVLLTYAGLIVSGVLVSLDFAGSEEVGGLFLSSLALYIVGLAVLSGASRQVALQVAYSGPQTLRL